MEKEKITIKEIIYFIVENSEDIELMDRINKITFPFTSKYKNFTKMNYENEKEHEINFFCNQKEFFIYLKIKKMLNLNDVFNEII